MIFTDEELIHKVAEEVMGWHEVTSPVNTIDGGTGQFHVGWNEFRTVCNECALFRPLSDLNHAFMVVERMRDTGHEVTITTPVGSKYFWETSIDRKSILHKSLGHAICLAALKAVENG